MASIAWLVPLLIELWVFLLHIALPAHDVDGYVKDSKGKPLRYRLYAAFSCAMKTALSY